MKKVFAWFIVIDGTLLVGVLLYYERAQLPYAGQLFLWALYALAAAGMVYLGLFAYLHLRRHSIQQNIIVPGEHGAYYRMGKALIALPAVRHDLREIRTVKPEYTLPAAGYQLPQGAGRIVDAESLLPRASLFKDVVRNVSEARMVLGVGMRGIVYGTIEDLLSTNVVGKPGRGKSTALYFFMAQLLKIGAMIQIFDPHATLSELQPNAAYEHDIERMSQMVARIWREMGARKQRFLDNGSVCYDPHYLLIVDELPAIASWENNQRQAGRKFQSILAIIREIVLQGRKFHMYALISGQGMPASVLPTLTRDSLSSHYVFFTTDNHARMAGLESGAIKALLPQIKSAGPGYCVLDAVQRDEPEIVAIPLTTAQDIYEAAQSRAMPAGAPYTDRTTEPRITARYPVVAKPAQDDIEELSPVSDGNDAEMLFSDGSYGLLESRKNDEKPDQEWFPEVGYVSADVVARIVTLATSGKFKRGELCKALGWSAREYPTVKAVLNARGLLMGNLNGDVAGNGRGRKPDMPDLAANPQRRPEVVT